MYIPTILCYYMKHKLQVYFLLYIVIIYFQVEKL